MDTIPYIIFRFDFCIFRVDTGITSVNENELLMFEKRASGGDVK